jgi:predicted nucleic acid-binding protein
MRTAVDTNVLSAIWGRESNARELSRELAEARRAGSVVICGPVFAEAMACPGATEAFVRTFLEQTGVQAAFDLGEDVWTQSGRRFTRSAERKRRSVRQALKHEPKRVLADFIIGAHALLHADRLMTLDQRRYRKDFPELKLV